MNTLRIETVNYEGVEQKQLIGTCRLVTPLSEKSVEYTNSEGELKSYKVANAKGLLPNGKEVDLTVGIPARNIELIEDRGEVFEIGKSYLTTVTVQPNRNDPTKPVFFARMSHLTNAGTDNDALAEAFGAAFGFATVSQAMTPKMVQKVIQDNLVDEEVIV